MKKFSLVILTALLSMLGIGTAEAAPGTVYLYHNSDFHNFVKKIDTYYLSDCYNLIGSDNSVKSLDNASYWHIVVYKEPGCDWNKGYTKVDPWKSESSLPFWGYSLKRRDS